LGREERRRSDTPFSEPAAQYARQSGEERLAQHPED
jgi:hypothetical protein